MFDASAAEGTKDVLFAFGEMFPAFEMGWDDERIMKCLRRFDRFFGGEGQVEETDFGNTCGTDVEDRGLHRKSPRGNAFVPDGVSGDVNALVRGIGEEDDEADNGSAIFPGWSVTRWRGDNSQCSIALDQIVGLPGSESDAVSAEPLCAFGCSQN